MAVTIEPPRAKVIMGKYDIKYIVLNAIRCLNILSILACIAASGSLLAKTANLSGDIGYYNFFDLAEKCFIILLAMCVLVTEIPMVKLLRDKINTHWPHFGNNHGFFVLSACFLFLGADVLSFLAKKGTDEEHLGGHFFRLVQAAGFMALVMAIINSVASIFGKRSGEPARRVRSWGKASEASASHRMEDMYMP
ncbi:hypothetical protein LTR64_000371 [Lithohypha guttulata]|uniref:uncharacterized protein n=1 Tax=Lithohypha guttulata TaxID=1690604 RepID=UPI002DDFBEF3|nr:hypothetical protein LTR51_005859 [Lithohypha guttulata]